MRDVLHVRGDKSSASPSTFVMITIMRKIECRCGQRVMNARLTLHIIVDD